MTPDAVQPWLRDALDLAALRPGERVLELTAHEPLATRAILDVVGSKGLVVAVEPDADRAERVRALPDSNLHVITLEPDGEMEFGRFDVAFACPGSDPGWPLERWGEIVRRALRPGGRFVLDLPSERTSELLETAWARAGGDPAELERWHGPSESDAARALRDAGLRRVESVVGTHFARFDSPFELAEFAALPDSAPEFVEALGLALADALGSRDAVEIVLRRTRLHGMR